MPYLNEAIIVFTRSPELGTTKTRLAEGIGDALAQRIAQAMLWDTLDLATRTVSDVICSFDGDEALMGQYSVFETVRLHQRAARAGIGAGISEAVAHAFSRGYSRVLLIPSDAPTLTREDLSKAIEAVEDTDHVSLIPSLDGGIVGLGLGSALPQRFSRLRNSTSTYCDEVADLLVSAGRTVHLLEPRSDIDSASDAFGALEALAPTSRTRSEITASLLDAHR